MRRGTTPTLTFTTPYEADIITGGFLSFWQHRRIVLDISLTDPSVTIEDNAISVTLTQEQTLAFDAEDIARAQIRATLMSGKAVASNIVAIPIGAIIKNGVI